MEEQTSFQWLYQRFVFFFSNQIEKSCFLEQILPFAEDHL